MPFLYLLWNTLVAFTLYTEVTHCYVHSLTFCHLQLFPEPVFSILCEGSQLDQKLLPRQLDLGRKISPPPPPPAHCMVSLSLPESAPWTKATSFSPSTSNRKTGLEGGKFCLNLLKKSKSYVSKLREGKPPKRRRKKLNIIIVSRCAPPCTLPPPPSV